MEAGRFTIETVGKPTITNPLAELTGSEDKVIYTSDSHRLLLKPYVDDLMGSKSNPASMDSFEVTGPRKQIYFDPKSIKVGIVTCGGLCPGLNSVIRALVLQLWHRYGCEQIYGIPFGFSGLAEGHEEFRKLTPQDVTHVHARGGSILGSSRGAPTTEEMVDTLEKESIDIIITIGGDGTMRGSQAIFEEINRRGLKVGVIGVPKTIDNDIPFVRRSFGFETAVGIASQAIHSAHVEAQDAPNGLGIVKLMGRHSGYIAASAALATGHTNFCLVPEVPFSLEGKGGLLELVENRLNNRGHCVVVIAEGCGQYYFDQGDGSDASGNTKLVNIGRYIRDRMGTYFAQPGKSASIKYIDPSYMIRAASANPGDQLYCNRLAHNAIHAAMAGKTGMLIGYWHGQMTHVPICALKGNTQKIDPEGELWQNVIETTGQPATIGDMKYVVKEALNTVWLN